MCPWFKLEEFLFPTLNSVKKTKTTTTNLLIELRATDVIRKILRANKLQEFENFQFKPILYIYQMLE